MGIMASKVKAASSLDIPRAHLIYTRDNGKRQRTFVPPIKGNSDEEANVVVEKYVRDARNVNPAPSIAEHGFQLIEHNTSLSKKEFYEDPNNKIEKVYYKEVAEAVKKVCPGAVEVIPFHHMLRKAPQSAAKAAKPKDGRPVVRRQFSNVEHAHGAVGQPAGVVHCDYTVRNAISLFDSMAKADFRKGRYAVINAWRNISDKSPIQDDHLAMCDARTVIAPDDFVPCDVVTGDQVSETYRLDPGQNSFHQWYYYPNMLKKEILIFMQYDSNSRTKTRYTFHTSLRSPHAQPDAQPRESIECRCIAFFPQHQPNTIPEILYKENEIVSVAIFKILQALLFAAKWPKDAQKWMSTELYKPGGVERIVKELVNGGAKRKEHGLDKASQMQRDEIIEKLLSGGTFEETAKSYFPYHDAQPRESIECRCIAFFPQHQPNTIPEILYKENEIVSVAIFKILQALLFAAKWPKDAQKWMSTELYKPGGVERIVKELVNGGAKRKEHGLDKASQMQRDEIIEKLLSGGTFEETAKSYFPPI